MQLCNDAAAQAADVVAQKQFSALPILRLLVYNMCSSSEQLC